MCLVFGLGRISGVCWDGGEIVRWIIVVFPFSTGYGNEFCALGGGQGICALDSVMGVNSPWNI